MNFGELQDELRSGILNDRTSRTSGASDYLWTDASLQRYINEAYRKFAVMGLVIHDGVTLPLTQVTLVEGQGIYPLDPSIISVMSVQNTIGPVDMIRVGHLSLNRALNPADRWASPMDYYSMTPQRPVAYSTDETISKTADDTFSATTLRVYPLPDAAAAGEILQLRVVRKPLDRLCVSQDIPELPEDHHLEMLDWAAYLALRIVDDDAGNPKRASEFAASFMSNVTEARKLVMRKLFAPVPWGFGQGGFTWEH